MVQSRKTTIFVIGKTGSPPKSTSSFGTLSVYNPKAILVDPNQRVWAATVGANLFRLEGNEFDGPWRASE